MPSNIMSSSIRRSSRKRSSPDILDTSPPPAKPRLEEQNRYCKAEDFVILNAAQKDVETLVLEKTPYRRKLLEVARWGLHNLEGRLPRGHQIHLPSAEGLVARAWNSIVFYWAKSSDDQIRKERASAYTTLGNHEGTEDYFPVIAFAAVLKANDYPNTDLSEDDRNAILGTSDGKRTLLLFFRKIKHEFLHLTCRAAEIFFLKKITEELTPEKYLPLKQNDPSNPKPEIGDHDEEEDSGAPVLPRFHYRQLSASNPLCLEFRGRFLPLNDQQVEGLLDLSLYKVDIQEEIHESGIWSVGYCRACLHGVLQREFYFPPTAASKSPNQGAATGGEAASRLSSPTVRTPETNISGKENIAIWRIMGKFPIVFPAPVRQTVSRSNSPLNEQDE